MRRVVIGFDVGATRLKAAAFVRTGRPFVQRTIDLDPADRSENGMVERLLSTAVGLAGCVQNACLTGVGIGVAGVINSKSGIITQSPNFSLWSDFALGTRLSERLGVPVKMDNDANCVALGEGRAGAAAGERSFICITLGTGVGGAIVLDGKIWRGEDGMAGEVGHICVDPQGPPCPCGSKGCLEQFASVSAMRGWATRNHAFGVLDTTEMVARADMPELLAREAASGHPRCMDWFDSMGRHLGLALGGLLNTLNVKLVVLAGGLSNSLDLFRGAMEREIKRRSFPAVSQGVRVVKGTLGEVAGTLGAASLLMGPARSRGGRRLPRAQRSGRSGGSA